MATKATKLTKLETLAAKFEAIAEAATKAAAACVQESGAGGDSWPDPNWDAIGCGLANVENWIGEASDLNREIEQDIERENDPDYQAEMRARTNGYDEEF